MNPMIGVFGAGGFGRETLEILEQEGLGDDLVFVDQVSSEVNGKEVIDESCFFNLKREKCAVVAISDCYIRRRLFKKICQYNVSFVNVVSAAAKISRHSNVEFGHIVCHGSVIGPNSTVGIGFQLNNLSYLAHDCQVGDFVTVGPNVVCAGHVTLEDGVYLGAGCRVRQGTGHQRITIGKNSIVGMGAVVLSSVPPNVVVAGNPAKIIKEMG